MQIIHNYHYYFLNIYIFVADSYLFSNQSHFADRICFNSNIHHFYFIQFHFINIIFGVFIYLHYFDLDVDFLFLYYNHCNNFASIVNDELTNSYSGSDLVANTIIAIEHLSC